MREVKQFNFNVCAPAATFILFYFICFLGGVVFSEYSVSLPFLLCMEIIPCTFSFRMVFFDVVTTGWNLASAYYVREFNQSNNKIIFVGLQPLR